MRKHERGTHERITHEPVINAAGPEWAVVCDTTYLDQCGGSVQRPLLWRGDGATYRTVLQVVSMDDMMLPPAVQAQPVAGARSAA